MAYLASTDDEDKLNQNGQQPANQQNLESIPLSSGGGDSVTNTSGSTDNGSTATAATPTAGFTDLSKYLDTNQPQASQLAGRAGQYIQGKSTDTNNLINTNHDLFNTQVDNATVKLNQPLLTDAQTNTTPFAADANKVSQLTAQRDATYKGPADFQSTDLFAPTQQSVNDTNTLAQGINNDQGRINVLKGLNTGKQYTSGQANLDQMLLLQNPDAFNVLKQGASSADDLSSKFDALLANTKDYATAGKATTDATSAAVKGGLSDTYGQFTTTLNNNLANARTSATAANDALKEAVTNNVPLTDAQLGTLGLTRPAYDKLVSDQAALKTNYGKDFGGFSNYLVNNGNANSLTLSNTATADDYAKLAAINTLRGTNEAPIYTPDQAGTANTDWWDLNGANAQNDLTSTISSAAQEKAQKDSLAAQQAAAAAGQKVPGMSTIGGALQGAAVGASIGGPVGAAIGGIIGGVFCHATGTLVKLHDGSYKEIEDLELGDFLANDDVVIMIGKANSDDMYNYKGDIVGGNHAVNVLGTWFRIKQLPDAHKLEGVHTVHPLITKNHTYETPNAKYADFLETDYDFEGELDAKLAELNGVK